MIRGLRLMRAALAGLVGLLAAAGTAAAQAPSVDRTFATEVTGDHAVLNANTNDGGAPSHSWFDFGTGPDLSNASRQGESREPRGYGGIQIHAFLNGLRPNTTYYFRAHMQTPFGNSTGSIESFRTVAAAAAAPPSISFTSKAFERWDRWNGWRLDFLVQAHGVGGRGYAVWSTDPGMANAQVVRDPQWPGGMRDVPWTGEEMHIFCPHDLFPDNKTIYVRAIVETSAGKSQSDVVSFENRPFSTNY